MVIVNVRCVGAIYANIVSIIIVMVILLFHVINNIASCKLKLLDGWLGIRWLRKLL